jgi:hypothetical protein
LFDAATVERLGEIVAEMVERAVEERFRRVVLAQVGEVATTAAMGTSPTRTFTGPNADSVTEAAVWVNQETQTADTAIWLPVRRGVTVAEGDVVRVERDNPTSDSGGWWVDAKL